LNVNTIWVVRLKGGEVKHFYSDDIRIYANPMDGNGWDIEIPKNWKLDNDDLPVSKEIGKSYHQNNLIKHPDKQFIYANNAEFYAGELNPLNTRIINNFLSD